MDDIMQDTSTVDNPVINMPYCARCFHSQCIPAEYDSEEDEYEDREGEGDGEDDDDSVSPIFREDPEDIEEQIMEMISDAMQSNPTIIWRASFQKDLIKTISTELFEEWSEDDLCEDYDLPEIEQWVKYVVDYYFKTESEFPPRQGGSHIPLTPLRRASIAHRLRLLEGSSSSQQRTQEWYETRYGLLTASNVWKALGTEAQQNQLITEKCQPFEQFKEDCARHNNLSSDNPMAWGQKYEPITAMIYEKMNRTQLGEYGCIVHPDWRFLGASPDGINVDTESPVYGRMVEIKNIVNRDIDGIPLDAYWVQMQIQMEVCDLDECDFVETRIKEYPSKTEFLESENPWRGVVLSFVPRITIESTMNKQNIRPTTVKSFYEYFLLDSPDSSKVDEWIQSKKSEHTDFVLSNVAYWGLDQYSCVLVKRNRIWFDSAIPTIERIWRIIETERVTGCEHRAPKKREPKSEVNTKICHVVKCQSEEQCTQTL
jgi:putative phage-type endonuclease